MPSLTVPEGDLVKTSMERMRLSVRETHIGNTHYS